MCSPIFVQNCAKDGAPFFLLLTGKKQVLRLRADASAHDDKSKNFAQGSKTENNAKNFMTQTKPSGPGCVYLFGVYAQLLEGGLGFFRVEFAVAGEL